jgi:hypothetical protein
MQIPDTNLDEFIDHWEQAYGERPDRDWARRRAVELLELFSLISRAPPPEWKSEFETPPAN